MRTQQPSRAANSQARRGLRGWKLGLAGALAAVLFATGIDDAPFVDEYAYITQSYQPDLLYAGRHDDPAWFEGLSYDLVPLPKYLINAVFRVAGTPRPVRRDAIAWYENTSYRWGSARELSVARVPSVLLGALGCTAVFALGCLILGEPSGWAAACLLAINPLYRLHAHRAMSEAPCEALTLVSLALGLWALKGLFTSGPPAPRVVALLCAGLAAGLAVLAKFNGLLAILFLAVWTGLALALVRTTAARKLLAAAATAGAAIVAAATFVALNPFMTTHPAVPMPPPAQALADLGAWGRLRFLVRHRLEVSRGQKLMFAHNALNDLTERARVVAVQGFGRFGPFGPAVSDSTRRYDLVQDWGAVVWIPLVLAGLFVALMTGHRQQAAGNLPTCWLLVAWAGLAWAVVGAYLPMAWDRYQLPVQAPAALLAAAGFWRAGAALGLFGSEGGDVT